MSAAHTPALIELAPTSVYQILAEPVKSAGTAANAEPKNLPEWGQVSDKLTPDTTAGLRNYLNAY